MNIFDQAYMDEQTYEQTMIEKMGVAHLGIEAEAFLTTPVGQYIQKRAQQEIDDAVDLLKVADPCDHQQITRLQNIIWRGESFNAWFIELINSGWEAEKEIRSLEGRE